MSNNLQVKKMAGIASFAAIVVVLQIIANYVTIGPVSITLSLIPIVLGAILYGPSAGAFLGLVNGAIILTAPSTLAIFMPFNPVATVILCLIKTTVAGYVAGWLFKLINKKSFVVAVVVAAISVPVINTGLFALGSMAFFMDKVAEFANGANPYAFLFLGFIGFNFIIEFLVNSLLSPAMLYIIRVASKNHDFGFQIK